ncbi:molecular chaperone HscC [Sporomusa termitida]|uniref:Chaperone protein DnaK n=1 Tax=Sporomusa termitida TaxID=2377 RepID=A0A517DZ05_9FIRM|nr:molecular chaperone HscC [Sporomusa termitida]QDR82581.1 Chaperone protein HscC [Sporomusa termitida]
MASVGIDLGTTNSLVAYWQNGEAVIIPNGLGKKLTPSVISVGDEGEIVVGEIARERLLTHPQLSIAVFKRFMGTNKTFTLGRYSFLPEELAAFVIRSLKEDAEVFLRQSIDEAIVSVPAYFNDAQRQATKRAGELAGLKVERLINEPTAAAIAYGLHQRDSETRFLVFDLGGGTFDVSIVELFENVLEVKAIAGNNYLGGEDFTHLLVKQFMNECQLGREQLDEKTYAAIYKQAEKCKQSLSQSSAGAMACRVGEQTRTWRIDRPAMALLSKPLLNQLRQPVEQALKDAAMKASELNAVILVGGATRMPVIHSLVSRLFGRLPDCRLNPDEVVAAGAAVQAAMKDRNLMLREVVLTDVCPYTLGIEVAVATPAGAYEPGYFSPIIERNTIIPVSRVERFYTISDNQKFLNVAIFQGESRHTKNNIKMGQLQIEVPPAPAGSQAIDVRYTYDINGILEVEVLAVETGLKKKTVIEERPGSMAKAEIDRRLAALNKIKVHPRDRQENRLLIARAERLYEELRGQLRAELALVLQRFEFVINGQNDREVSKAAKALRQFLDDLEDNRFL